MSAVEAFTNWDDVPLVATVQDAARVLNTSPTTIYRRLEAGKYVPGAMPREGKERYRFSKKKLREFVEGGYARMRVRKA